MHRMERHREYQLDRHRRWRRWRSVDERGTDRSRVPLVLSPHRLMSNGSGNTHPLTGIEHGDDEDLCDLSIQASSTTTSGIRLEAVTRGWAVCRAPLTNRVEPGPDGGRWGVTRANSRGTPELTWDWLHLNHFAWTPR